MSVVAPVGVGRANVSRRDRYANTGPSAFITTTEAHAAQALPGSKPKPPKHVAKNEANPRNMPGTSPNSRVRPVYIRAQLTTRMSSASTVFRAA